MIKTVDCDYMMRNVASAYYVGGVLIDNGTNYSVPNFLQYPITHIIITHVHLDHAGGTGLLAKHFPDAVVVAHPRAAPHVIDPSRLVASASAVYGKEKFAALYGEILPVPAERVVIPADGETIRVGDFEFEFIYTRGHANHHFVIHEKTTKSIFTGDSFGLGYPMLQHGTAPFLFPSTSPTDFDAAEARISYDKVLASGAQTAYPTHFGAWRDIALGHKMLMGYIDEIENEFNHLKSEDGDGTEHARAWFENFFARELAARQIVLTGNEQKILNMDIDLNAQGLAFAAARARKKSGGSKNE